MAIKKKQETPFSNINTNNNINNINVNVKVPRSRKQVSKKSKPNWILKAIIVGIIGLVISFLTYYINNSFNKDKHKPAIIENGTDGVPTPHVHENGKVRPANNNEIPKTDLSKNK